MVFNVPIFSEGFGQDIMLMQLKQKTHTHTFVQTNKQSLKGKSLLFFYITNFSILHLAYYLTGDHYLLLSVFHQEPEL